MAFGTYSKRSSIPFKLIKNIIENIEEHMEKKT
jgi:hypothetical protein